MTGIQDTHLNLRNALQAFINSPSFKYDLKTRWLENRLSMSQRNPNLRVEKISLERVSEMALLKQLFVLSLTLLIKGMARNTQFEHRSE